MKRLVWYEYRKLWNHVSVIAVLAMAVIAMLYTYIYMNIQRRTITADGQIISGLPSYRALKDESEELEGVMDGEYLKRLKESYDSSFDKKYLAEHSGFLGTAGMSKYCVPNYCVNFAYYSFWMTNGNDKMSLDYDFLDSEEHFYEKFKEAVRDYCLFYNQYERLKYTDAQLKVLDKKIAGIKTPFKAAYYEGLGLLLSFHDQSYLLFLIALCFALAGTYAKDSRSGISELTLSAKKGRKSDFRARWAAGNLFAVTVYLIYVLLLTAEIGAAATLHGWSVSAHIGWPRTLLNVSMGTGVLLRLGGGLLTALTIANFILLLSCRLRNRKAACAAAVLAVYWLNRYTGFWASHDQLKLLSPMKFYSNSVMLDFIFVGNTIVPYCVIAVILAIVYLAVLCLLMRGSYKKFWIH